MQADHLEYQTVPIRPVECLKESKALIGDQYWLFVGITTIGLLIASAVPMNILLGPMMCGIYLCFRDRMNGKRAVFDTLFKGFDYFVETLIATLILMGVTMVVIVPLYIVMVVVILGASQAGDDGLPLMMGVVFGATAIIMLFSVLVYVFFIFVYPLILFGRLKAIPAIKTSVRAALANFAGILGLVLLIFLISTVAAMCCYVPAFLVAPILIGSVLMAYRKVFPDGFVNEQPFQANVLPDEGKPAPQPSKPNDFA
jgi:hypothetical protein